jgi:hypothetical protein
MLLLIEENNKKYIKNINIIKKNTIVFEFKLFKKSYDGI